MKNIRKRSYSIALSLILTLTISSISFASYDDVDVNDNWSSEQITRWSDNQVVQGSNNKFRPADNISRSEVATILNNVMKYQKKSINNYVDLGDTWYTNAMLKSNAADVFEGYGLKIRPEDNITREETATVFARAFNLGKPQEESSKFSDEMKISSWAKDSVITMEERGYVIGYEGKFRPQDNITRAEVVKLLDNVVKGFYNKPGTYSENIDGIVVINNSKVKLRDSNIDGDVIVSEGVSNGHFYLNDVNIKGSLKVNSFGTEISVDSSDIQELKIIGKDVSINTMNETKIDTIITDVISENVMINGKSLPAGETVSGRDYIEEATESEKLELAIQSAEEAILKLPTVEETKVSDKGLVNDAKALIKNVKDLNSEAMLKGEQLITELEAKIKELEEAETTDFKSEFFLLPTDNDYDEVEANKMIDRVLKIPTNIIGTLYDEGVRIILCDGPITDESEYSDLKEVTPRGWEGTGKTWDDIPGAGGTIRPIARIGHSHPGFESGHNTINLELHELAHTIDNYMIGTYSISSLNEFTSIWKDEVENMLPDSYFVSYKDEYFAETFAMYYLNDSTKDELMKNAPRTYDFISNLENQNPSMTEQENSMDLDNIIIEKD